LIEREIEGERVPEPIAIKEAHNKSYRQIHQEIRAAQKRSGEKLGSFSGMTCIRFIPNFLLKTFIRLTDKNIRVGKTYGKLPLTAIGMYSKDPGWIIPHGIATVLITVGSTGQ